MRLTPLARFTNFMLCIGPAVELAMVISVIAGAVALIVVLIHPN